MFLSIYIPFVLIFLRTSLLLSAPDYCGNLFESFSDFALTGHTFDTSQVDDNTECAVKCTANDTCQSYNLEISGSMGNQRCELNNHSRISRPRSLEKKLGFDYYGSVLIRCAQSNRKTENDCKCHHGYKGQRCLSQKLGYFSSSPGHSCKHIRDSGDSTGDGEYWIDPEKNGRPLKVLCDMTTDGGGWLNVATLKKADSSPAWTAETSYRGISNYQNNLMGISTSAMRQLRSHLNFTQLRFHCSKENGRTFHVITVNNCTGEAVVQYFSGQSSVLPASCGSFITMKDDNSYLAKQCHRWGNDGSRHYVGKWGHFNKNEEQRIYDHSAFVARRYHWAVYNNRWLCDEPGDNVFATSTEDFWKIYVR